MAGLFLNFPEEPILALWLKIAYTIFLAILIPVYWKKWGLANFLWFSDLALFIMFIAVWFESSLLASMMGIAVLIPETAWNISYFTRLITGKRIFSLTDYMFDSSRSYFVRALSLFHVILPPLVLFAIRKLGFNEDALVYQLIFGWSVLLISYIFTNPKENINLVFGMGTEPQSKINPHFYFFLVLLAHPILFYLPAYFLLKLIF